MELALVKLLVVKEFWTLAIAINVSYGLTSLRIRLLSWTKCSFFAVIYSLVNEIRFFKVFSVSTHKIFVFFFFCCCCFFFFAFTYYTPHGCLSTVLRFLILYIYYLFIYLQVNKLFSRKFLLVIMLILVTLI